MKSDPKAARGFKPVQKMAEQMRANFRETPEIEMADLFVVFILQEELFIRSTEIRLEDTWCEFWDRVSEWTFVEIEWYCHDHKIDSEGVAKIMKAIQPDVYRIDIKKESLIPIEGSIYNNAKTSQKRIGRQFAFLMRGPEQDRIDEALRHRIKEIRGWQVKNLFDWKVRIN